MKSDSSESSSMARDFLLRIQSRGWRCSLSETQRAMDRLGNPEKNLKVIHIAGTNGKGSVAAICASILQSAGLKTGLFISPHLIDVRERITINGKKIPERVFSRTVIDLANRLEKETKPPVELTFFEFLMAVCIEYLVSENVDVLVAESGLGGRFDATNVLQSDVAVFTQIALDHTAQLGATVEKIAEEKAGIIKNGDGVVSAVNDPDARRVIAQQAFARNCSVLELGRDFDFLNVSATLAGTVFDYEGTRSLRNVRTNLLGSHQAENASTAIAACDVFAYENGFCIDDKEIILGLRNVYWPGRLEIVSRKPLMILDCAHNPSAMQRSLQSLEELDVRIDTLVYSTSKDKDFRTIARSLFPKARRIILTRYGSERAIDPSQLASLPEAKDKEVYLTQRISEAIELAKRITSVDETILITGSVFLVGSALSWLSYGIEGDFSLAGFAVQPIPKN